MLTLWASATVKVMFQFPAVQPRGNEAHPRGADQPRTGGDRVFVRNEPGEPGQGRGDVQVNQVPAGRGHGRPRQVHPRDTQARAGHWHSCQANRAEIVILPLTEPWHNMWKNARTSLCQESLKYWISALTIFGTKSARELHDQLIRRIKPGMTRLEIRIKLLQYVCLKLLIVAK